LTGNKDIRIGGSINPETMDISTYKFVHGDGQEVALVDTPGFDDNRPHMTDSKLLEEIADFLTRYAHRSRLILKRSISHDFVLDFEGTTRMT